MPRRQSKQQLPAELKEANDSSEELEGMLDDIAGTGVEGEEEDSEDDYGYDEAA